MEFPFATPQELNGSNNHCAVHAVRSVYSAFMQGKGIDEASIKKLVEQTRHGASIFGVAHALLSLGMSCQLVLEKHPLGMLQLHELGRSLALLFDKSLDQKTLALTMDEIAQDKIRFGKQITDVQPITTTKIVENKLLRSQFNPKTQCLILSVCGNALMLKRSNELKSIPSNETRVGGEHMMIVKEIRDDGTVLTSENTPFDELSWNAFESCRQYFNCDGSFIVVDLIGKSIVTC